MNVLLSFVHEDTELARRITLKLQAASCNVAEDVVENSGPAFVDRVKEATSHGALTHPVLVLLVTVNALNNPSALRDWADAITYESLHGSGVVWPVVIDDLEIPVALKNITHIRVKTGVVPEDVAARIIDAVGYSEDRPREHPS